MDTSLEQLDSAIQNKDSESLMSLISYKTNSQRIKLREEYKTTFSRDLFEDFKKSFKGEFLQTIIGIFKTPVEYDVDLLNNSLKGFSIDKDVISEIICFRGQVWVNGGPIPNSYNKLFLDLIANDEYVRKVKIPKNMF